MKKNFIINNGNLNIRGVEFYKEILPNKKYKSIITCHGYTGYDLKMEKYCNNLIDDDTIAYSFCFCGTGDPRVDKSAISDGKSTDVTIFSELKDLKCIYDYVNSLDYVDNNNISLLGESIGGLVATLFALDNYINKLVLVSPAFSLPFHARKGRLCGCLYDPNNPPIVLTGSIIDLGVEFHNEVINIDFLNEVEKIKVNTLLIQGMNDPVVHFSYAKGIKNKDIKKVFIDKMTHGLDEIFIQDIMNEIRCFLLQ